MQWETILTSYLNHLRYQERSDATIQKYRHDIQQFLCWCNIHDLAVLTRESVISWRRHQEELFAPATVNAAVAAVNGFLAHVGKNDCCVKPLRVQHAPYYV